MNCSVQLKISWMWMKPEAGPIEFTNGHAHFYGKKKMDKSLGMCRHSGNVFWEFRSRELQRRLDNIVNIDADIIQCFYYST